MCEIVADPPGAIVTVSPEVAMSQLIESNQVTVNMLVPVLVRVTPSTLFGPPTVPVYASEGGEALKPLVEVDCVMDRVTGRIVLLIRPLRLVSVIVTCVEYDPAVRPAAVALTEMVSVSVAIVPDEGVTVIQGAFSVTVHVCSLDRLVERATVCGEGSALPLVAEKMRALGLTCKAHDGFAKPRSIANANRARPSIVDAVCRIGPVRRSWFIVWIARSVMKPFRCMLFAE